MTDDDSRTVADRTRENMERLGIPKGTDDPTLIALGATPLADKVYRCHCNWCDVDFESTNLITNICPDCRSVAQRAYDAALFEIRARR